MSVAITRRTASTRRIWAVRRMLPMDSSWKTLMECISPFGPRTMATASFVLRFGLANFPH